MNEKGTYEWNYYLNSFKRVLILFVSAIALIALGTFGFLLTEHMSAFNAFYTTIVVVTGLGYNDIQLHTVLGKLLTVGLVLLGISIIAYGVGLIIQFVFEGHFLGMQRRRKMEKKIFEMKDHFIICGFGRVGHQIAKDFERDKTPFVVIDTKPQTAEELEEKGIPFIIGEVSSDEVLEKAGIKRAKGLLATADSDTENVYVTLAARVMNPSLNIIARAGNKGTESKLKRAGANSVMAPYYVAGNRMASMALTPVSIEFLDIVTGSDNIEFWMKEFKIEKGSRLADRTLGEANIRQISGVMILSIKKTNGRFDLSPKADSKMEAGDILIALGTTEQLSSLEKMM